ncbi:MAG: sulfotransferase [Desulfobacterales bacterium]
MGWVFLILSSVCFVEIFIRSGAPGRINELNTIVAKIANTIRSPRISDCWKEKVLPHYALKLFLSSLLLFALLLGSFSLFIGFSIFSILSEGHFLKLASSPWGIVSSTVVAASYAMVRSKRSGGNYGFGSKLLHRMVLGNTIVGEATFDLERLLYSPPIKKAAAGKHVFVAGLARAGTTILMRSFFEQGPFCSLTYRDMPFILAPNLWRTFNSFSRRQNKLQERAHGDGLMVNYDSPEALEEVFWRVFCKADYIKPRCLVPMVAERDVLEKFRSFVGLVLEKDPTKRYLSKNNNNILRLGSIAKAFPNAIIVVPFREPRQQAYSLMKQHERFRSIHAKDHFSKTYMTWLAHHEFGADHRPFRFNEKANIAEDTDKLSYWLERWIDAYTFIRENLPNQSILVAYESLCHDTDLTWQKLAAEINLLPYANAIPFSPSTHQIEDPLPSDLVLQATAIYNDLVARSIGST